MKVGGASQEEPGDRCCMAVVSSCREMLGSVPQRAQPSSAVASASRRALCGNCGSNTEEGGDDVKSAWPLRLGLHPCYNGRDKGMQDREVEPIPQTRSQFGLQAATRLHEVGIASNRRSAKRR